MNPYTKKKKKILCTNYSDIGHLAVEFEVSDKISMEKAFVTHSARCTEPVTFRYFIQAWSEAVHMIRLITVVTEQ